MSVEDEKKMEVDNEEEEDEEEDDALTDVLKMPTDEIVARTRLLDNEIRIMKAEIMRIQHEAQGQKDRIKENTEKIKVGSANIVKAFLISYVFHHGICLHVYFQVNKTLPFLVANVIEILDVDPEDLGVEEDGAHVDLDSQRKGSLALLPLHSLSNLSLKPSFKKYIYRKNEALGFSP